MNSNNTLHMKRPASWPNDLGRDATPLGNGKTGVLVHGGAGKEKIIFNRSDLWHNARYTQLPRLDGALQKMRDMIDSGDYENANDVMYDSLRDAGYVCDPGAPFPLGCLQIKFSTESLFSHYRRKLHMDKAESEITYTQKTNHVTRKCFVSRFNDTFYYEYSADEPVEALIYFGAYNDGTPDYNAFCEKVGNGWTLACANNGIDFLVKTDWSEYGAKIRVYGTEVEVVGNALRVFANNFRLAGKCDSGINATSRLAAPEDFCYGEKLKEHLPVHRKLYNSADIKLGGGRKRANEDLLEKAYEDVADPELIEKMWRFGRYLFICGTSKDGLPFPLYGLWHTKYIAQWAQHVANENVEIIHWHANAGGLVELVKPLIDYYYSGMDIFKENADKLFGCSGIFIGGYSSPANLRLSVFVPVILNFTGVAGWLSQHFYQYYRLTGDKKTLNEKIFPFMIEAAKFYLDYIAYGDDGKIVYYPSVSPENTPTNLINEKTLKRIHSNPVTKNSVIEIAIVKELFTNLISLISETGDYQEYLPKLKKALADMPAYLINADGAIKEWVADELDDNYDHRHVSHIYPLFPGEEITKDEDPELYAAVERAVDLRKLGAQTGWSLAHTASIYATLGRGDHVLECLDILFKGCTLNNFVTLHNDYRNMGVALNWKEFPVQMDANMGVVNAVQKMLFDERKGSLLLLPAIPDRLKKGSASGLCFTKGKVSMKWDLDKKQFNAKVKFTRTGQVTIKLPEFFSEAVVAMTGGSYEATEYGIRVYANAGTTLTIEQRSV